MNIVAERIGRVCFALMVLLLVVGIGWPILSLPTEWNGLRADVVAKLDESGVRNPVTAVLLNFRGYDTLLEIGVLLVGVYRPQVRFDVHVPAGVVDRAGGVQIAGQVIRITVQAIVLSPVPRVSRLVKGCPGDDRRMIAVAHHDLAPLADKVARAHLVLEVNAPTG